MTEVRVAAVPLAAPEAGRLPGPEAALAAMDSALAELAPSLADVAGLVLFPAGTGWGAGPEAATLPEGAAELARRHDVWLCPGTWLEDGRHCTGLFAPDGSLVASQAQTHLAPGEPYTPGDELTLAETPFGQVGMLVGRDAWVPEVSRILARRGARLLLAPVLAREPYSEWDQIAGVWAQVQQNQVFAAESGWTGPGFGGRPAVMAPCEMTAGLTGYLAQSADAPAVALLDEAARQAVRQNYDILGLQNPALYARYLPRLYRAPALGSGYPGATGGEPA